LSPLHRRRHCWCAHTSLSANFQCSPRVALVPFCMICSPHLIAVWFLQAIWLMIPAIAIISRLLCQCLQGTRGSFKFPKNALLSFCRNIKSAVHVPYAGWLILSCSALARTHDFKNFLALIQTFRGCCKTFTMLWCDAAYRCLCVQSSVSSHLHHLSYRRLSVLICLQAPVSLSSCFCTSFSAGPLRIAFFTLLSNVEWRSWSVIFPASRHGCFHVKTARFVHWHHVLPTFGSEIALFARMSAPSFASSPRCAFTLTSRLLSPLQSSFVVSRWLLLEYPQVPPLTLPFYLHQSPCWLPSTMTDCHTNTATTPLSAWHKAPVKTLPIQTDLSLSHFPLVSLCTAAFPFSFSNYYILIPCCPFCLNHQPLLGPEIYSLQACLSLFPSSNRILSLSIAVDIRLFFLTLRPLSKLFFVRLPHGNLGEPSAKHTLRSLRIWCCPVATTLSSSLTALCLLSYPSFLLLWLLFAYCGLRRFLHLKITRACIWRLILNVI